MAMPSPAQVAQNWSSGMGASTEKMKQGITAVTESPTAKAARRIDAQVAGVQRAAASGKTQAALERVSLEDWKRAALEKGVGRVAGGAMAAKQKFQDFMSQFLPHVEQGKRLLESTPRGDLETNINRAAIMMRHNATFRRSR